jgi:hypothetical protein
MEGHILEGVSGGRATENPFRKEFADIVALSKQDLFDGGGRRLSSARMRVSGHRTSATELFANNVGAGVLVVPALSQAGVGDPGRRPSDAERRRLHAIDGHMTGEQLARVRAFVDASDQGLSAELGPLLAPEDRAGHAARATGCGTAPDFAACVRSMWLAMLARRDPRGSRNPGLSPVVRPRSFSRCETPRGADHGGQSMDASGPSGAPTATPSAHGASTLLKSMHVGQSCAHSGVSSFC